MFTGYILRGYPLFEKQYPHFRGEEYSLLARRKKAVTVQKTLLSVAEVAVMLGVCRTTVYRYISSEGLPSMLLRGVRRIHPDSLAAWLKDQEQQIA